MTTRDLESFSPEAGADSARPEYRAIECKVALSPSKLPGLDFALNPYQGCAHDCVYCFAPAMLRADRSGWAREVGARMSMPKLLAKELRSKKGVVGVGTVTDPYQPLEAHLRLTRKCLEELSKANSRVSLLTKSDLVVRDLDLLRSLPQAEVGLSITLMDDTMSMRFEPGAPPPRSRLLALKALSQAGLDTYAMIGPILPGVLESDLEPLVASIAASGTRRVMTDRLRLRPGLMQLFQERLDPGRNGLREFMAAAGDQNKMRSLDQRIERACSATGLRYERAF
jgi:DNA repair photolyase